VSALSLAIGCTPRTEGLLAAPPPGFAVEAVSPISRAFAPMLRAARDDVSEMAIASFLMAPALTLASRWCAAQGLTPRELTLGEIWAGTPDRFT
jgi:hypothetical protein